jgi:hypothetical protein
VAGDPNAARFGVPGAVRQRFLNNPIHTGSVAFRQSFNASFDPHVDGDPAAASEFACLPFQRGRQPEIVKHRWPETHGHITHRPQSLLGQGLCRIQVFRKVLARRVAEFLQVAEFHAQRRQHLSHLIVKLSGYRLSFFFLSFYQFPGKPPQFLSVLLYLRPMTLRTVFEDGHSSHAQTRDDHTERYGCGKDSGQIPWELSYGVPDEVLLPLEVRGIQGAPSVPTLMRQFSRS